MTRLPGRLRRGRFYPVIGLLQRNKMNAGPAGLSSEPPFANLVLAAISKFETKQQLVDKA